jgi:hypothetical protein
VTPDEYNRLQVMGGHLTPGHVTAMTEIAQRELGLAVDGKCGPKTRAAIEAQTSPLPTGARPPQTIGEVVVAFAVTLIGQGEAGANNSGEFITRIGGQQGWEWCALSAGYAWRTVLERAGAPAAWTYRRPGVPEPGALALAQAALAARGGKRFRDATLALPGDLIVWDKGHGKGHIGIVEFDDEGLTHTLEGNVGRYPSKYKRLVRDVRKDSDFWAFVRPGNAA